MNAFRIESVSKENHDGSITGIVLAKSGTQFITWEYTGHKGYDLLDGVEKFSSDTLNCYNGHYYTDITTAAIDFDKRTGRL